MTNINETKSSFLSWNTAGRIGFTGIFFFWIYMIWISTADLSSKLSLEADKTAAVHNIQFEFNNEIQEWKNLLLRSTNQETLDKNWQIYETQYQKVFAEANNIISRSDVPAVNERIRVFIDTHAVNHDLYKKYLELLIKSNFSPHQTETALKEIDRPLLTQLEAAQVSILDDKKRKDKALVDTARNKIEQNLFALAFLALLAIWMPKY